MKNSESNNSFTRWASDITARRTDADTLQAEQRDGNSEAWLTVLGSFLIYYSTFGLVNSFGFFQEYYQAEYLRSTNPGMIALIGTLQIALMNCVSAISGALCDSYGFKVCQRLLETFNILFTTNSWPQYLYVGSGSGISISLLLLSITPAGAFWRVFVIQGFTMGFSIAFR